MAVQARRRRQRRAAGGEQTAGVPVRGGSTHKHASRCTMPDAGQESSRKGRSKAEREHLRRQTCLRRPETPSTPSIKCRECMVCIASLARRGGLMYQEGCQGPANRAVTG